jgi:hypothetical protein
MADHPQAKQLTTIAGLVLTFLVLAAWTFGMGEWASKSSDTAQAPASSSTVTR